MIFVDTGAWYALATPSDPDHERAKAFVASIIEPLVTSNFVVDELLTLFVVRGQKPKGIEWTHEVLANEGTHVVPVSDGDYSNALKIYEQFADKQWSFTDCTSYVLIQRLALKKAFAFDKDFRQFGLVSVLPE